MAKKHKMSIGGYEIIEELGRGGMSVVYKATQPSLNRIVALKVLPRHLADEPEFVNRFEQEANAIASLNHPHIIQVYDKGQEHRVYYFVMEFVDGHDLTDEFSTGPLPLTRTVTLAKQICQGLAYAHKNGIVHRDIKPQNILIDSNGFAKIADFGIAQLAVPDAINTSLTKEGVAIGTLDYMAPEQKLDASTVDEKADLYAFGVVLYEMLTGQLPHPSYPLPSNRNPRIPATMDKIVEKLLQEDPKFRYPNAEAVLDDLEKALKPPSKPSSGPPRALYLAGGAVALLVLLGGGLWVLRPRLMQSKPRGSSSSTTTRSPYQALAAQIALAPPLTMVKDLGEDPGALRLLESGLANAKKQTNRSSPPPKRVPPQRVSTPNVVIQDAPVKKTTSPNPGQAQARKKYNDAIRGAIKELNRGRELLENQIFDDAESIFHAVAMDTTLPDKVRALAFLWEAKSKEAKGTYQAAVNGYLSLSAEYRDERLIVAEAQYHAGHLQGFELNKQQIAMRNFVNVIDNYPDSSYADDSLYEAGLLHLQGVSMMLGAASKNKQAYQDAYTQFGRILERYPKSEWADDGLYQMARIQETKQYRAYDQALSLYQRIIDEYPESPYPAYYLQAEIYAEQIKDLETAVLFYTRSMNREQETEKRVEAGKKKAKLEKILAKQAAKQGG